MSFESASLLFPTIYDEHLEKLLQQSSTEIIYPAKHTFSVPGDGSQFVYYIKEGRTKHYMMNDEGTEKILYSLNPGWFFMEVAWFLNYPTGLYSQTETDTVLYRLDSQSCHQLLDKSEAFRERLITGCCHKILLLRYEVENLTFNSSKSRIKRLLISSVDTKSISDPGWYDLKVKYTHYEMGMIIGSVRVTVSKLMNELCDEGFLRVINRRVQVNAQKYREYISLAGPQRNI